MDYMDDPRKGAYNLGKDSSHSDSNIQFRDKTQRVIQVQEENERHVINEVYKVMSKSSVYVDIKKSI